MKRAKLFLAVTTVLLSIAGAAATKVHNQNIAIIKVFFKKATGCTLAVNLRACDRNGTGGICKTLIGTGVYTLYTSTGCIVKALINVL